MIASLVHLFSGQRVCHWGGDAMTGTVPRNTVLHGDCITLMRRMPSACVDFVLTDPPYVTRYRPRDGQTVRNDDSAAWLRPAFRELSRLMKPATFCVSFYGWARTDQFFGAWRAAGLRPVGHIVFRKLHDSGKRFLRYQHEAAYLLAKGDVTEPKRPVPDVIDMAYTGNVLHPTQKDERALRPLVQTFSPPGGLVFDPFCGSGSSLVAAAALGRAALGIDLVEKHCLTSRRELSNALEQWRRASHELQSRAAPHRGTGVLDTRRNVAKPER
jgi:site-specific DNA-methyltransferase (adenine-specific)